MTRTVTENDLQGKSDWELDVMRNEIYARYGRWFNRAELTPRTMCFSD
jgi:serine/threonine-protein kinase